MVVVEPVFWFCTMAIQCKHSGEHGLGAGNPGGPHGPIGPIGPIGPAQPVAPGYPAGPIGPIGPGTIMGIIGGMQPRVPGVHIGAEAIGAAQHEGGHIGAQDVEQIPPHVD